MTDSNLVWMRLLYSLAIGQYDRAASPGGADGLTAGKRWTWRFWDRHQEFL